MEEKINEIIEQAKNMRKNPLISNYKIAEYVHIELGKIVYYDNNYTAKLDRNKEETKISTVRKNKLLKSEVNKSTKAQICKGMAEIYAEILNKVGIEARSIGVERKGETQEVREEEAKHYCAVFKIDGKEYVQDYLMEAALMRIKIGEVDYEEEIPGICAIEDYSERGTKSLAKIELSHEFLEKILGENIDNLNDKDILNIIFNKLNDYLTNENNYFGFEEAKDFIFLTAKNCINNKSGISIVNLVKESENECGVACIYEIEGQKFLVRGGAQSSDLSFPVGKITENDLKQIQEQGYEGRSMEEETYLQLNQVRDNNNKINEMINMIITYRKDNGISLQEGDKLEEIAKLIIKNETLRCIKIYKAEYGQYGYSECRGKEDKIELIDKALDCSGGTDGLGIGKNMNYELNNLYGKLEKYGVETSGVEISSDYNGSLRDQLDFFLQLKQTKGIDLDYVRGALAHEAKHTYGVIGGNTFIKEGITEQTTREDCDKYGLYMSPTAHTQEANFVRMLELVVGRDEVVKVGLYNEHEKMKNQKFEQLKQSYDIDIEDLEEYFKIIRYDIDKIKKHDEKERDESKKFENIVKKFQEKHPEVVDEINNIKLDYNSMNKNDRYESLIEKFQKKVPRGQF